MRSLYSMTHIQPGVLGLLLLIVPHANAQEHEHGVSNEHERPREGSGTSWQPASSPMEGLHFSSDEWAFMVHGFANFAYQKESDPRGRSDGFSTNMAMFSANRGGFGIRFMASLEPMLGSEGYRLLLQTGETADGRNPLYDRQHPHDVLMEVSMRYRRPVTKTDEIFFYFAPVGDPAIGPTAFMHRAAAVENPVAPIAHHWLDATHISYGVSTFGWSRAKKVKLEGSLFNGREPDANRWDVDPIRLDSFSARMTVNPSPNWSLQGSLGLLQEPEILHPGQDLLRMTASATYNRPLPQGNWQTTIAWGRNKWDEPVAPQVLPASFHIHFTPGVQPTRSAFLVETGWRFAGAHSLFARWEFAEKDELFRSSDRRHQLVYQVSKLNAGYVMDFLQLQHLSIGAGAYGSLHWVPDDLLFVYGERPKSYGFFLRFKIL